MPKTKRRTSRSRTTKSTKNSPPLELVANQPAVQPQSEPEKGGVLDALLSPFKSQKAAEPVAASLPPQSESGGKASSTDAPPIDAATLGKLDAIPDVIGEGEATGTDLATKGGEEFEAEDVRSLMAMVAFEEGDVREGLEELFAWIAEVRKRPHYNLSDRQARLMARPIFMLANSTWTKLMDKLPDIIVRWFEAMPGMAGSVVTCVPIVASKVGKDFYITRAEKLGLVQPEAAPADGKPAAQPPKTPTPQPQQVKRPIISGATADGIPMVRGTNAG